MRQFSDGKELTADDVLFNFKQWLDIDVGIPVGATQLPEPRRTEKLDTPTSTPPPHLSVQTWFALPPGPLCICILRTPSRRHHAPADLDRRVHDGRIYTRRALRLNVVNTGETAPMRNTSILDKLVVSRLEMTGCRLERLQNASRYPHRASRHCLEAVQNDYRFAVTSSQPCSRVLRVRADRILDDNRSGRR